MHTSRRFLLLGFALLLFAMAAHAAERKPNVVVLIADQWRAQAFGFAGDPNVKTPNFDKLASESVRFAQAVSGISVCSPTRASLLTGQRPLTHGVFINDVPLNPEATTVAKVFKEKGGYDTAAIGKWHVDGHGRESFIPRERRQGFDYWKVLECTHDYNNSRYYSDTPVKMTWSGYDAQKQAEDAAEYIRAHGKGEKPFLLWLAWGPPHNPYLTAPDKYRMMYRPDDLKLRPNIPAEQQAQARKDLAGYYAHCSTLDDALTTLLDALRDSGQAENTIFLFTADHGDMLGSQGMQRKQKPYEESVRVPMLVRWPAGLKGGRSVEAPINTEDVMPTLLGLAGLPIPKSVEGLSYADYLRGGADPSDGCALIACPSPFGEWERRRGGKEYRGIRTARYTYVRDLNGPWLLFDNQADPYQEKNLVGQPEHAALQAELDTKLQAKLKKEHDDFRPGPEYIAKWGWQVNANGTAPTAP
jgi:arylsulfatase A-like enzyme